MPVSKEYADRTLSCLELVTPVTSKRMFGGVGIYCGDLFFALMDNDITYFKVDDVTRSFYEERGLEAFSPFGDGQVMSYYRVPQEILALPEELTVWVDQAVGVAERARSKRGRKVK